MLRQLALAVALLSGAVQRSVAQGVVVAPHAVYLDHRTRSASITLYNPSADPAEVTISTFYGYPVTDSVGHFMLQVPDSVDPAMPSATAWVDAFPRRMTVPPLSRQAVRLLARPPQGLPDGEYWSRIAITATGGAIPVSSADTNGIAIGLSLEVRTIIPLLYRKGTLSTGIVASNLRAMPVGDSLVARVRLERRGTAAFVGMAKGTLVTETGTTVASFQQPVAVYYDAEPVFALPIKDLLAGRYRLRVELSTERTDIAQDQLLRAAAVRDSIPLVLP
jgi:P pilus assembly chaperone PapD